MTPRRQLRRSLEETGMIREILKMGDPRILQVASPVEDIRDFALRAIIADMY